KNEIWTKLSGESTQYSVFYRKEKDTASLTIFMPYKFQDDFPSSFFFDTAKYHRFDFYMYGSDIFKIVSLDYFGKDHVYDTLIQVNDFFEADPFYHFAKLSALKDSLGVYGISYSSNIGNFITFWLS